MPTTILPGETLEQAKHRRFAEEAANCRVPSKYVAAVEKMSTDELDDWYEEHVGYRLSQDDPEIVNRYGAMPRAVAEMMCLHEHGEGAEHDDLVAELIAMGWSSR